MATIELKSSQFRRERETSWRELEHLIDRLDKEGPAHMAPEDLCRLPVLYRSALSAQSVAHAISLDRALLTYLDALAARAYLAVYAERSNVLDRVARFFSHTFPRAVSALRWHILAAFATLMLGVATGLSLTLAEPEWFYAFVSDALAQGRSPAASDEILLNAIYDRPPVLETLVRFASFLFTHNAGIGLLAFGLGIVLGIPTLLLMLINGLMLGSFIALYADRGLGVDFLAWLSVHGTTEILAIALCGGAGLSLGAAVVFPGRHGRLASLADRGRQAAVVVLGAALLFFLAALLEGFVRQLVVDTTDRFLIGWSAFAVTLSYLVIRARARPA